MKKVAWFVFFAIIAVSCLDEPDCFQLNNNVVIVAFGIVGGGADAIALNGITAPGVDGVFYADTTLAQVALAAYPMKTYDSYLQRYPGKIAANIFNGRCICVRRWASDFLFQP